MRLRSQVALLAAAAWSASSDEPSLKVTYQGEKELTNARKIQRNAALKADALANRRLALNRELSLIIGAPLPAWADTVPASNMSYSFQDYLRLERDPRRSCRFECKIFGETCGLCKNDCPELLEQIGPRLVAREDADVVILSPELSRKTSHAGAVAALVALPRRPPGSFYLLHKRSHGLAPLENCGLAWPNGAVVPAMSLSSFCALLFRPDVIFADVDLGEHDLDDDDIGSRLRGITLPTGGWTDHKRFLGDPLARFRTPPPQLLWFRGRCHHGELSKCHHFPDTCSPAQIERAQANHGHVSRARLDLSLAFNGSSYGGRPIDPNAVRLEWTGNAREMRKDCPGVVAAFEEDPTRPEAGAVPSRAKTEVALPGPGASSQSRPLPVSEYDSNHGAGEAAYLAALASAAFALCPHGDERWNLRFLELLSAGTIPVVIADGLTLPFAQLIAWDQIAVAVPEAAAGDPWAVLSPLLAIVGDHQSGHGSHGSEWTSAEVARRSALALAVFHTYFGDPQQRVKGVLAAVEHVVRQERGFTEGGEI